MRYRTAVVNLYAVKMDGSATNNRYLCPMCYFECVNKNILISHAVRHHRTDPQFKIQCTAHGCGSSFSNWGSFKKHVSRNHPNDNDIANLEDIFNPIAAVEIENLHEQADHDDREGKSLLVMFIQMYNITHRL